MSLICIKSRWAVERYAGSMLQQHLVIVVGPHGDREAIPVVCGSHEIFEKARQVLAKSDAVGAEVWRGAEQLYVLGQVDD